MSHNNEFYVSLPQWKYIKNYIKLLINKKFFRQHSLKDINYSKPKTENYLIYSF